MICDAHLAAWMLTGASMVLMLIRSIFLATIAEFVVQLNLDDLIYAAFGLAGGLIVLSCKNPGHKGAAVTMTLSAVGIFYSGSLTFTAFQVAIGNHLLGTRLQQGSIERLPKQTQGMLHLVDGNEAIREMFQRNFYTFQTVHRTAAIYDIAAAALWVFVAYACVVLLMNVAIVAFCNGHLRVDDYEFDQKKQRANEGEDEEAGSEQTKNNGNWLAEHAEVVEYDDDEFLSLSDCEHESCLQLAEQAKTMRDETVVVISDEGEAEMEGAVRIEMEDRCSSEGSSVSSVTIVVEAEDQQFVRETSDCAEIGQKLNEGGMLDEEHPKDSTSTEDQSQENADNKMKASGEEDEDDEAARKEERSICRPS